MAQTFSLVYYIEAFNEVVTTLRAGIGVLVARKTTSYFTLSQSLEFLRKLRYIDSTEPHTQDVHTFTSLATALAASRFLDMGAPALVIKQLWIQLSHSRLVQWIPDPSNERYSRFLALKEKTSQIL